MRKVKARLKSKSEIELLEKADIGDIIDLNELNQIDSTNIEKLFEEGLGKEYQRRLEIESKRIEELNKEKHEKIVLESKNEFEIKINNLQNEIKRNEEMYKVLLEKEVEKSRIKDREEINDLKNENKILEENLSKTIENEKLKVESKYNEIVINLKNQIKNLEDGLNINVENEKLKLKEEYNKKIYDLKVECDNEISSLKNKISELTFQKSIKNVKQTGEDLESWCNNEVLSYMQNGFYNCIWFKDNQVIKETEENKGSKADFIFKIYADEKREENDLLTSICLEMKDENPESINKKTNDSYYKQLDKNRNKKGCKYAILVSNLELDKPNILPIYKVVEYDDMYVCRPGYLMTILNIITSLTNQYKDLLLKKNKEIMELEDYNNLLESFEEMKRTYLDKPLEKLEKDIEKISVSNETIKKQTEVIDSICNEIISKYILDIRRKLDNFKITKIKKSMEKIA